MIYRTIFSEYIDRTPIKVSDKDLIMTYHPAEDGAYAVILNHFKDDKAFTLSLDEGYCVEKVYYGNVGCVKAFDACVIKIGKCTLGISRIA